MKAGICATLVLFIAACAAPDLLPDAAIDCRSCEEWNQPQAPVLLADNTWYVGVKGLSSILIDTQDGLILLDGGLPQSAPLIADNIRSLGFSLGDIEIIALSHAHYDHAGGIAALQRASGARVVARLPQAEALRNGGPMPDDPQYGRPGGAFPPVSDVDLITDGWEIEMGAITLTALATPGHTPGGTTWTWTQCATDECSSVTYADSLSPISADGFRFSDGAGEQVRRSALRIMDADCDILLAPHPGLFGFGRSDDSGERYTCVRYGLRELERLRDRLEEERGD